MVTLDRFTAPLGCYGWIKLDIVDVNLKDPDDIKYLQTPAVLLSDERNWLWLDENGEPTAEICRSKTVYSCWTDALKASIKAEQSDIDDDRSMINLKLSEIEQREARLEAMMQFLGQQRMEA